MGKLYWIGLALVFIGLALLNVPIREYRFFTFLSGSLLQLAGVICMFTAFFQLRRAKGGAIGRRSYIILAVGILVFIIGILAGFFLGRF